MSDRERKHWSGKIQAAADDGCEALERRTGGKARAHGISAGLGTLLGIGGTLLSTEAPKIVDYVTGKPAPYTLAECLRDKDKASRETWGKAREAIDGARGALMECLETCR